MDSELSLLYLAAKNTSQNWSSSFHYLTFTGIEMGGSRGGGGGGGGGEGNEMLFRNEEMKPALPSHFLSCVA